MKVCGQLHELAALLLEKEQPVSSEKEGATVTAESSFRQGAGDGVEVMTDSTLHLYINNG
jgi:hypothetical protein